MSNIDATVEEFRYGSVSIQIYHHIVGSSSFLQSFVLDLTKRLRTLPAYDNEQGQEVKYVRESSGN